MYLTMINFFILHINLSQSIKGNPKHESEKNYKN